MALSQHKDKAAFIVIFAIVICLISSAAVSSLAVVLKDRQKTNAKLDKQKNILRVAGLLAADKNPKQAEVDVLFADIEGFLIDRKTGERVAFDGDPVAYNQRKIAKTDEGGEAADSSIAKLAQVKRLPDRLLMFEVKKPGKEAYILPISGNGLWSTLLGFLAVSLDGQEVLGLTYYSHAETPGLGGEVDNPDWKAQWPGKNIYGPDGEPMIMVRKGAKVNPDYEVDCLSGATITSNGVTYMLQLWLGEQGYKPFFDKRKAGGGN